jgi:hypothetical protein
MNLNLNLSMNNIDYNSLQRLTFELLGRAPHLSPTQLNYVRSRVEDLVILMRNENGPNPLYMYTAEEARGREREPLNVADLDSARLDNIFDEEIDQEIHDTFYDDGETMFEEEQGQQQQHNIIIHISEMSNEQIGEPTEDICPICHETHTFADVATMECCSKHIGTACFRRWIESASAPTCPCCRTIVNRCITYEAVVVAEPRESILDTSPCSILKIDCREPHNRNQWFIDNDAMATE